MKTTIKATLLILASSLTLSTTALAKPFQQHGSGYTNAISNADFSAGTQTTQRVQSVQRTETMATTSGFNDRSTVENEAATFSRRVIETPISRMLSIIANGFNDRS